MKTFKKSAGFAKKPFGMRPSYGAKRGFSRNDAPTERFQATCNECGDLCEVPFKPNGKKPVYCRNCFKGKEETTARTPRFASRHADAPSSAPADLAALGAKIDRLTAAIEAQTLALIASGK